MKANTQKGSALIIVTIMTMIFAMLNISLLLSVINVSTETKLVETSSIKSYYATIAGMRYASILLSNNIDALGFTPLGAPGDPVDPEVYNVTGTELGDNFFADMGISSSDLSIIITEINTGADAGEYNVVVRCNY
jgi:hypothetical protein